MGLRRVRHTKFFRAFTIVGASLGLLASTTFTVIMGLDVAGANTFITDELRTYTATFKSGDTIISETKYYRGELVETPETPEHEMDGEGSYLFIGWDTTGDGIVDFVPPRIYYNFTANACFMKLGEFDINWLDLLNMDLEDLLDLMEKLNIDWEQFMDMFNIDPETLMEWLKKNAVLTFEADDDRYISYFRSTSLGEFNYSTKSYGAPNYYDSNLISDGSVNPLNFTADKLQNASKISGTLPDTFAFVNYDITFKSEQDYYPVPDCQAAKEEDNHIDSDAHYLKKPVDNKYQTYAAYAPAFDETIRLLKMVPFSNTIITKDERQYYKYALENYTKVPSEYISTIDDIINSHDWYEEDYNQINEIGAYVENLGSCSLFEDGEIKLNYKKNKDPVFGLIENKKGSDLDFNTTAMMIFRRLRIPARMVKGYVVPDIHAGTNIVTLLNQHYWCEIYVKGIGWMICDCMNAEDFLGTNPYGEMDKKTNPLDGNKELQEVQVDYFGPHDIYQFDELDKRMIFVHVIYTDGSEKDVSIDECKITGFNSANLGDKTVTVTYTEGGTTKGDTFNVRVVERPSDIDHVEFDFSNAKKEYYLHEKYSSKGIKVRAYYRDGSDADITALLHVDSSQCNMDVEGYYTVYADVQLSGHKYGDEYEIHVSSSRAIAIDITTMPTKTTYYVGDSGINAKGMKFDVTYEGKDTPTSYRYDDYTGDNLVFENDTFTMANEHHEVTMKIINKDDSFASTTFEVRVEPNVITGIVFTDDKGKEVDVSKLKTEFKSDEFYSLTKLLNGYIPVVTYANGSTEMFLNGNYNVTEPNMSIPGYQDIYFQYTNGDGDYFERALTINIVAPVGDEVNFSLSNNVSTSGPGTGMANVDVFKLQTSYVGTMYIRNASYGKYSTDRGWYNESTSSTAAESFVYDKAKNIYQDYDVSIEYSVDVPYGLSPMYSNVTGSDVYITSGSKQASSVDNYKATMFDFTTNYNTQRLQDFVSFSSSSITTSESNYRMNVLNSDTYGYAEHYSYPEVENFINEHYGQIYSAYGFDRINAVKNILQSEFTYNINFSHSSTEDPIRTFFETKEGICNNFASAATLIYRRLGYNARYVTGFGVKCDGTVTMVGTNSAHAWCEIYIENLGWVVVDATGYDDGHTASGASSGTYYGDGFGGEGLYHTDEVAYGGTFTVTYDMSNFEYDDFYNVYWQEYNGQDLFENKLNCVLSSGTLPDFLRYEIEYNTSSAAGPHMAIPVIRIYDKETGNDVTAKYGYLIGAGSEGIYYEIDEREIEVLISPKQSSYSVGTLYSSEFNVEVIGGDLVAGHQVYLTGSVYFNLQGEFEYYEGIEVLIRDQYYNDYTSNYSINVTYGKVVITA